MFLQNRGQAGTRGYRVQIMHAKYGYVASDTPRKCSQKWWDNKNGGIKIEFHCLLNDTSISGSKYSLSSWCNETVIVRAVHS